MMPVLSGHTLAPAQLAVEAVRWLAHRFVVYLAVVAAAGTIFLAGAGIYALLTPEPTVVVPPPPTPTPAVGEPGPAPVPSTPPDLQRRSPADLYAQARTKTGVKPVSSSGTVVGSSIIGLVVYGKDNERVGKVTELIMDQRGSAQGVVIGLDGYWMTSKFVYVPFETLDVQYRPSGDAIAVDATMASRAVVPYSRADLQKLPPSRSLPAYLQSPADPEK